MRKIGISSGCFPIGTNLEHVFQRFAKIGFDTVDFDCGNFFYPGSCCKNKDFEDYIHRLRETADKVGLTVNQTHAYQLSHIIEYEPDNDSPQAQQIRRKGYRATQVLGAKWIVEHPLVFENGLTGENYIKTVEINAERLKRMCYDAEKYDIGIAIENTYYLPSEKYGRIDFFGYHPDHLIEVVDKVNAENCGICLDTGHSFVRGFQPAEMVLAYGSRIKVLHVSDNCGLSDDHNPPLVGQAAWNNFEDTLTSIGFPGPLSMELTNYCRNMPPEFIEDSITLAYKIGKYLVDKSPA